MLPPNCKEERTRKRLQDYTLFQTTEASSWGTWNSLAGEFYHRKEEVIFTFEVGFWRVLLLIGWPSLARSFHTIQKVWEKPSSSKRTNTPSTSTSWDNHRCPTMLQSTAEHKANWGTTFPLWTKTTGVISLVWKKPVPYPSSPITVHVRVSSAFCFHKTQWLILFRGEKFIEIIQ